MKPMHAFQSLVLFVALALLAHTAVGDTLYNATPLTIPNNNQPIVEGINNNGQVLLWNLFRPLAHPRILFTTRRPAEQSRRSPRTAAHRRALNSRPST